MESAERKISQVIVLLSEIFAVDIDLPKEKKSNVLLKQNIQEFWFTEEI
jgi:hypothetical protein